eukprot:scaffold284_cov15-Tisochrysis_lutea.AAC.1
MKTDIDMLAKFYATRLTHALLSVADFGLARPFISDPATSPIFWTDYVATRWYRAPELCGCFYGRYTQAVDIWSIGCIFAEVLLGRPLFPGRDAVSQLQVRGCSCIGLSSFIKSPTGILAVLARMLSASFRCGCSCL